MEGCVTGKPGIVSLPFAQYEIDIYSQLHEPETAVF